MAAFLLLLCLLLTCSHPISCTCSGSQEDPSSNLTVSGALDQLPGYLFLTNMSTCRTNWVRVDCGGLRSYMKTKYPALDLSNKGWFFVRQHISLLAKYHNKDVEASFSVFFTMSIYQPNQTKAAHGSLVFAMEPLFFPQPMDLWATFTPPNWQVLDPFNFSTNSTSSFDSGGGRLSAEISTTPDNGTLLYPGDSILVQIGIDPPSNSSVTLARKYSVWIDYDHISHRMSVHADAGEDAPKPVNPIANKNLTIGVKYAVLGLFSSVGQLLHVHTWNSTVDYLPDIPEQKELGQTASLAILISVLATMITTALVGSVYLDSKYRKWKKEKAELTKIMQGIPGVPAYVDYSEIRDATKNFHGTTKLGKGGFGAVYRCKLPVVASRTGRRGDMDVAVKKFTREVEDHRCSDFITEVSIINRLRHKNIVPLIGE